MKNLLTLLYMLTLLLSVVGIQPAEAQEPAVQDALYIYRNDGGFHGFFYNEIERFDYSRIDTLGVEHEDYVVQEVITADSIYRIPLSAIDSIGFVTPETVYKKDVAHTTESDMWNYVISSDSLQFVLAANTPIAMIPKMGDKLITTKCSDVLPTGFIGKVTSISNDALAITVTCDYIDLEEIYDQHVIKFRTINEDEALSRGVRTRSSGEESTITIKNTDFDYTIDYLSPGTVSQLGVVLISGKVAKVRIHGTLKTWTRVFCAIHYTGRYKDITERMELNANIIPTINSSITLRGDIPFPLPPIPIGETGFILKPAVGLTSSLTGSINESYKYHANCVLEKNIQDNFILSFIPHNNSVSDLHLQKWTDDIEYYKVSGSGTFSVGAFGSLSLLLGPVTLVSVRQELGAKATLSAEFNEDDYKDFLPKVMPESYLATMERSYRTLSHEFCVSLQPYYSIKMLTGAGVGSFGTYGMVESSYDLDKLSSWYPDAFPKKPWKMSGQLAPNFSEASFEFIKGYSTPVATVGIGGRTFFDTPVGLTTYYAGSGKRCGETVWSDFTYFGWYNLDDGYSNISEYSLQMPKFGGGKKVNVFPTYKLFGIELLGFPRTSYILPAKLESAPKELTFEAKGGEEKLIVTDNLDRSEDKFTDENGVTTGDDDEKEKWLTVKKEGDVYKVTAKPNTSNEERTGTVDFYVHNEDRSIDLVLNVPVLQKAAEYEFSVSPEDIKVAGYNKDFKGGELTQQMTIVYPNTAKGIKVRSSDESWLTVDDTWASSTVGELNTTGVRTIHIKPNFNLDTPRDGFITIELTKADGSVEPRTLKVNQSAFELKVELDPDDLMLTAEEKPNAAYSHKAIVAIKMEPTDSYVKAAIKSQDVKASMEWIEAEVKDDVIEVRAKANPVEEDRKATLTYTVEMKDGGRLAKTINVTQLAKQVIMAFTFSPEKVRVSVDGGEKQVFVVGDDVERIIEINCMGSSWLGGGASGKSIILVVQPNENENERMTTVYITCLMKDGTTAKEYFFVTQDGTKTTHEEELSEGWPTEAVINGLRKNGMPIYFGDDPAKVEGVFSDSPNVTIAKSLPKLEIPEGMFNDWEKEEAQFYIERNVVFKYTNQKDKTIYVNAYSWEVNGYGEIEKEPAADNDIKAVIMGSGNKFTIAMEHQEADLELLFWLGLPHGRYGLVMSGEIVETLDGISIHNFHIAFTSWNSTSIYCIGKDSDGICGPTAWEPGVDDDDDLDIDFTRSTTRTFDLNSIKNKRVGHILRMIMRSAKRQ